MRNPHGIHVCNFSIVRLGHPARVQEELQKFTLDGLISHSEQTALVRDIYQEIDQLVSKNKRDRQRGVMSILWILKINQWT